MLNTFNFNHSRPVRAELDDAGIPWFVAKDVCDVLGIKQATRAVESLDDDEKGVSSIHTQGGIQQMLSVNESGVYALIFRSRKPEAKAFRKWVTSEVLPALRQTGGYSMGGTLSAPVAKSRPWNALPQQPANPDPRERVGRELIADVVLEFDGYPIRVFKIDGIYRFVAADCLRAVGYKSPNLTLSRLPESIKRKDRLPDIWGAPRMIITVTADGAQELVSTSRKSRSVRFRMWMGQEATAQVRLALQ